MLLDLRTTTHPRLSQIHLPIFADIAPAFKVFIVFLELTLCQFYLSVNSCTQNKYARRFTVSAGIYIQPVHQLFFMPAFRLSKTVREALLDARFLSSLFDTTTLFNAAASLRGEITTAYIADKMSSLMPALLNST